MHPAASIATIVLPGPDRDLERGACNVNTRASAETMTPTAESLYLAHRQRVYHLCLRLGGGNIAWAEDITQDVFVKLLAQVDKLRDVDDLGGWIYRVTVNTCLKRLKRERSVWGRVLAALTSESSASSGEHQSPERQVALRHDLAAAMRALGCLPPGERVAFTMRHLDDLSQREIAAALSLSEGYVSKLLGRARERLARQGREAADA